MILLVVYCYEKGASLNKKKVNCFLAKKRRYTCYVYIYIQYTLLYYDTIVLCYSARTLYTILQFGFTQLKVSFILQYYHNYYYTTVGGNPAMSCTTYIDDENMCRV